MMALIDSCELYLINYNDVGNCLQIEFVIRIDCLLGEKQSENCIWGNPEGTEDTKEPHSTAIGRLHRYGSGFYLRIRKGFVITQPRNIF